MSGTPYRTKAPVALKCERPPHSTNVDRGITSRRHLVTRTKALRLTKYASVVWMVGRWILCIQIQIDYVLNIARAGPGEWRPMAACDLDHSLNSTPSNSHTNDKKWMMDELRHRENVSLALRQNNPEKDTIQPKRAFISPTTENRLCEA